MKLGKEPHAAREPRVRHPCSMLSDRLRKATNVFFA